MNDITELHQNQVTACMAIAKPPHLRHRLQCRAPGPAPETQAAVPVESAELMHSHQHKSIDTRVVTIVGSLVRTQSPCLLAFVYQCKVLYTAMDYC